MRALIYFLMAWQAYAAPHQEYAIVALGDSVSVAYNASGFGNNRNQSFSTGKDPRVKSHAWRFQELWPQAKITTHNMAKAGARSRHIIEQWARIQAQPVNYATIFVGANDICDPKFKGTPQAVEEIVGNVEVVILDMIARNPGVTINLLPVPNFLAIHQSGRGRFRCEGLWEAAAICPAFLGKSSSETSRRAIVEHFELLNRLYFDLARSYPNVHFVEDVRKYEFSRQHLSLIDCFHPSVEGQRDLAELSWSVLDLDYEFQKLEGE